MTTPGVDGPCTPEQACPKGMDPSGISWWDGCWCYRNLRRNSAAVGILTGLSASEIEELGGISEDAPRTTGTGWCAPSP